MTHPANDPPEQSHAPVYNITINADAVTVHQARLSFDEVCRLAFPAGPFGPKIRYTVTYSLPDGHEGSMVQGDTIEVLDGEVFYVGNTDRS